MVYVSEYGVGYVYFLKGYKQDFMRFNTLTRTWENMPDAPAGARAKWDKGSWLVYDGGGAIYAHKAKYHELWTFDLTSHQWGARLPGMPFQSGKTGKSKKSQNGGAACWFNNRIYALKGNNTCEFWMYDPGTQIWTELDPMPEVGTTGKRKRVKGGGDIVSLLGALWALKGNKTAEFWRYGFTSIGEDARLLPRAMGYDEAKAKTTELAVTSRTISYTLSRSGFVRLTIYDQMGRKQWEAIPGFQLAGEHRVNFGKNELTTGIYFVRLEVANSGKINQVTGKMLKLK